MPTPERDSNSFYANWVELLRLVLGQGQDVSPRKQIVRERLAVSFTVQDARRTLLVDPLRNLNYRFMVAEFLWIAQARSDLAYLAKYNPNYALCSDDGETMAGAYGPRLMPQWEYLKRTLYNDPDSRQAVATIWTPSPEPSKDIPCTVACQFLIRQGQLHSIWTMRSSDLWLGLPYDVWTFSMLQQALAGELGVDTGSLTMQLGSAHLYKRDWDAVCRILVRGSFAGLDHAGAFLNPRLDSLASMDSVLGPALRQSTKFKCLEVLLAASNQG